MIYERAMVTEYQAIHNFRIWKLVDLLLRLNAISAATAAEHALAMNDSKMVGLMMDLDNYTLGIDHMNMYKF